MDLVIFALSLCSFRNKPIVWQDKVAISQGPNPGQSIDVFLGDSRNYRRASCLKYQGSLEAVEKLVGRILARRFGGTVTAISFI